jgi:hypothetical protein
MGYRSHVAIAIPADAVMPPPVAAFVQRRAAQRLRHQSGSQLIRFTWIPWFGEDPEIQAVITWLHELDTYRLCRIGEHETDVEEEGPWLDNPFQLAVMRRFHVLETHATELPRE